MHSRDEDNKIKESKRREKNQDGKEEQEREGETIKTMKEKENVR